LHVLFTMLFDRHGFVSINATRNLVKKLKNFKPDVILLHNIHGYYLNIRILFIYLEKAGIPVFWTVHDCWSFSIAPILIVLGVKYGKQSVKIVLNPNFILQVVD